MAKNKKAKLRLDRHTWTLVRRLLVEHVRPHIPRLLLAFLLMAVVAGTTAALAWLIQPILDGADPQVAKDLKTATGAAKVEMEAWLRDANYQALHFYAVMILAVFLIRGVATYGQGVMVQRVGQRILADIQVRMYEHVIRSDIAFFHRNSVGSLISRFNNDIQLMRNMVTSALTNIGKDLLTLGALVAVMFYQDWVLSLITFVLGPAVIIPIVRLGRRMRRVSVDAQEEMGEFTTLLEETFQGARHVKAYGMEAYEVERASGLIDRIFRLIYKSAKVRAMSYPIMETIGGFAIVAVLIYGGYQVIEGNKTTGIFFSFVVALLLAFEPAKRLANLNANLQEGLAAADRVFHLIDAKPEIVDAPDARPIEISKGEIRFEGLRFSYRAPEEEHPALNGIDLTVPPGKLAALVGPSGAGKSTVFNMIPRFYDPDEGRVVIDGQPIRDITIESLRANIALVSQEVSLFDDSVRANIMYGKPDATEEEIARAARNAAAHDFIMALPEGYETRVGGRGMKLSGGQRQRIAIARAMLKDAPILLLDEATSSLDTESERAVQEALETLMTGRTTLVIAHRLSTVVDADVIYVMERGRITEAGTHTELLGKGGMYARLYAMQLAGNPQDDSAPAVREAGS